MRDDNICFVFHRMLVVPRHLRDTPSSYVNAVYGLIRWQGEHCHVMDQALSSYQWDFFAQWVRGLLENHVRIALSSASLCSTLL